LAYISKKDVVDCTYNSTDLKAYVVSISGLKIAAVMQEWHAPGSVSPSAADTGMRQQEPVVIEFLYDGTASGPCLKAALGTSATLTITLATGMSITGTFIVSDAEVQIVDDGDDKYVATFTPSGTVTWDLQA